MSHQPRKRTERGSSLIDRAMGRDWTSKRDDLLREALWHSNATRAFYVYRTRGGEWQIGSYALR